jgi:hypothetical protein
LAPVMTDPLLSVMVPAKLPDAWPKERDETESTNAQKTAASSIALSCMDCSPQLPGLEAGQSFPHFANGFIYRHALCKVKIFR